MENKTKEMSEWEMQRKEEERKGRFAKAIAFAATNGEKPIAKQVAEWIANARTHEIGKDYLSFMLEFDDGSALYVEADASGEAEGDMISADVSWSVQ